MTVRTTYICDVCGVESISEMISASVIRVTYSQVCKECRGLLQEAITAVISSRRPVMVAVEGTDNE